MRRTFDVNIYREHFPAVLILLKQLMVSIIATGKI